MKAPSLSILGIGLDLPPSVSVREYAASKGADVSFYKGWERVCHVRDENDQPSTLAARALERALLDSGVAASELRLVIFTGVSRDYPASWSAATEVMKLNGVPETCVGLDMTIGCLATLSALDMAQAWLMLHGGGCAAVVSGERWSYTVDHSDPTIAGMWAWADGGAAFVVGMETKHPAIAEFLGAEFTSRADYNGHVLIPYGGTRTPIAPPGVNPYARTVSSRPRNEVKNTYAHGYGSSYARLVERLGVRAERLVCNQMSPQTQEMIAAALNVPMERVVVTGHETGHLGAGDAMVGVQRLREQNRIDGPIAMGASTAYAWGVGILVPPVG